MSHKPSTAVTFRVADLRQNKETRFDLRPDAQVLKALVRDMDLLDLRKASLVGSLRASGKSDWTLTAELGATVVQPCVVTLAPVTTRVQAKVVRHFLAEMPEMAEDEEIEMPEDENAEILGSEIDIGAILSEALALNLPLYPRASHAALQETAFTEPGKQAMTDEDARPFAGLASLRDKLGDAGKK